MPDTPLHSADEDEEVATPHRFISDSLSEQRARSRTAAIEAISEEFGFSEFDAGTLALAAADLSQVREAIRKVRRRRYGSIIVKYIELDIATWHILPSPENVRFEESRVRSESPGSRFASLDSTTPVLVFNGGSSAELARRLDDEAEEIWMVNEHAATIPLRGIENPGLLSVSRIETTDRETVGVLDATDGFGRTVGPTERSGSRPRTFCGGTPPHQKITLSGLS